VLHTAAGEIDRAPRAIAGAERQAEAAGRAGAAQLQPDLLPAHAVIALGRPELAVIGAEQALARPARQRGVGRVRLEDAMAVALDDADGVGRLVQQRAE